MDSDTLLTASTYLNNLLTTRGLLRNTKSIDFAKPTRETRAQIINLVHDLLLKRDRDEEAREGYADSLHQLRSECDRKDTELERLRTQLAEKDRLLVAAQVETRAAKADLKRLQTAAKGTQNQLVKTKALVEQVKTQCLNDVRKRDAQIDRLKTHIQGQQRGNKSLVVAPSIAISGLASQRNAPAFNVSVHELQDPAYTLKQETNEFLTQLSQSLSDENDSLLSLVHTTLSTLRTLLGSPDTSPATIDQLSTDLHAQLSTLTALLTNPSFVSVEEVDIRDDEIARLRAGWEKMEARWRDVLGMMDGWKQQMERGGGESTIDLAELRRGLGLGADVDEIRRVATSPSRRRVSIAPVFEESILEDAKDSGLGVAPPQLEFFDLRPPKAKGVGLRQLSSTFQSPRRVAFDSRPSTAGSEKENKLSLSKASLTSSTATAALLEERPEPLSLAEKLAHAAQEAESAKADPKPKEDVDELPLPTRSSPARRKSGIAGRPGRRRKSTLSPEELEGLLAM